MAFLRLYGESILSPFRHRRLLQALRLHAPELHDLQIHALFLVDCAAGSDTESLRGGLRRLFGPGPAGLPPAELCRYVVPRLGTTSPWSSKATDIARVCGLAGVQRLEQARVLLLHGVADLPEAAWRELYDQMTETVLDDADRLADVFAHQPARSLRRVVLGDDPPAALERANREWGLALSADEIAYLADHYRKTGRDPTDAELMMFGQINSEHCRHKIFNGAFTLDGAAQPDSPFDLIRASHRASPDGVLSAYKDNAAVVSGPVAGRWFPDRDGVWRAHREPVPMLMKVETHNHPTGISPHAGAATGAGGEIRDEAATGRGGRPKAGLCGFTVSNLHLPGDPQPWEAELPRPSRMASALTIMLEGPIGASAYNNEFGRPNLCGYFRTFEDELPLAGGLRGYHKPVMVAGGYGNVRLGHVDKLPVPVSARLVVLGGPAMLIGLGGGAASSMATGASTAELDFASVQRANPELQRRCQEVIDACWRLGEANPILSIHDVGAGGLSNALPEIVDNDGRGGRIRLRDIHSADPGLSPMEIWCNEAQERYVLAIEAARLPELEALCVRERCPLAVVGEATAEPLLRVEDGAEAVVDMPMPVLLGKAPRLRREATRARPSLPSLELSTIDPMEAAQRVLRLPAVASKEFLITIGDRSVGGLSVRDQMVGPWQVPVADCAVTATAFDAVTGEAMAMGERPLLALGDAAASARMALGEALTNLASASVDGLRSVRLSANWMAAAGSGDEDARLYDAVRAVGAELCPALGIAIPVGKDSLSMRATWRDAAGTHTQTAPLTLIVSAFAPVVDVRRTVTPQLHPEAGGRLLLVDLGAGRNRLGGSALGQVYRRLGGAVPDVDDPALLKRAFETLQHLLADGRLLACHDRSDGGLFATLCEMAYAGRCGFEVVLDELGAEPLAALFNEELGWVLQVAPEQLAPALDALRAVGLAVHDLGRPSVDQRLNFVHRGAPFVAATRLEFQRLWSQTSARIAALRDDPDCVVEALDALADERDTGLRCTVPFTFDHPPRIVSRRPPVAILREQGVNGQAEMAWAFDAAGFEAVDVHMSDLASGRHRLDAFAGFAACGGFSYGDVLGAGRGWAASILFNAALREQFSAFLADPQRFALGVCNGCQMLSTLAELIPGSQGWPRFVRNRSEQFEARWSQVTVPESRSIFLAPMAGASLPVAVAHGEGRAVFAQAEDLDGLYADGRVSLRFTAADGLPAQRYPANPNGSPDGITGICNADGRVTLMMPHPERSIAPVTGSWWPQRFAHSTPWIEMFRGARRWVG